MTTSAADHYRQNADECGKQAEKASSPQDKERWLKQAEKWLDLAQQAEAVRVGRVQAPDEKAASKAAVRDFDIKKSADLPINWPQSVRSD
jgi:hypothetical protein